MFGNLFRRTPPQRSIDDLIRDVADHQKLGDYSELLARLPALTLYLKVLGKLPDHIPREQLYKVKSEDQISISVVSVKDLALALFFTSPDDPRLEANYAAIDGREAARMTLRVPDIDGLVVQSRGTGWVGLDRAKLLRLASGP